MTKYVFGQRGAAVCLLVAGSIILGGVQLLIAAATQSGNQSEPNEPHPMTSPSPAAPAVMPAAVAAGEFEPPYQPTPTEAPTPPAVAVAATTIAATKSTAAPAPVTAVFQSGIASTYGVGDGFQGRRTACGQVFDAHVVQLAHKSLPCGTRVRVEDASSGRSVEARVTDRGPYVVGRIADLSWAAFQQIHPSGPGLVRVNLYVLDG